MISPLRDNSLLCLWTANIVTCRDAGLDPNCRDEEAMEDLEDLSNNTAYNKGSPDAGRQVKIVPKHF